MVSPLARLSGVSASRVASVRRRRRYLLPLLVLLYVHWPCGSGSGRLKAAEGRPSATQAGAPTLADTKLALVQQAPAGVEKAAASADGAFRVVLPDGASVELVGLCEYPSAGHDWWRPDGSPLGNVPAGDAPKDVKPMPGGGALLREVALEGAFADGADVGLNDAVTRVLGSSNSLTKPASGRKVIKRIRAVVQLEPDSRTTFVVQYAPQPWTTLARFQNHDGTVLDSHGRSSFGVVFPAPSEEQGSARMVAAFDLDDLAHHEVRIIAFDKKDRKQITNQRYQGGARGVQMLVARFEKLPLSAISWFQFQSRKIEHVEFRNVSLHRGQKTNFAMSVEDQPYKPAVASPTARGSK